MRNQVIVPFPKIRLGIRDLLWSFGLAAPFLVTHFLTSVKLHWVVLLLISIGLTLVPALMVLQWASKQWPQVFSSSISVNDLDIVLARPLGREVTLPFNQIKRIVALSSLDAGYGEANTRLVIYTNDRKAIIGGDQLYCSNLLERVQQLPGFDHAAYAQHEAEESSMLRCLFSKRTELLKASL